MENSRTCESFIVNVHRASFVKHLRSKNNLEIITQNDKIIPEVFFKEEESPIRKNF